MSDFTSVPIEILRMRAHLRNSHEELLRKEQDSLVNQQDEMIHSGVEQLNPSWRQAETEFAMDILKIYERALMDRFKEHKLHLSSKGQGQFDLLMSKISNDENRKEVIGVDRSVLKKVEESVLVVHQKYLSYLNGKRNSANSALLTALQEMKNQVEMEGQELWKKEVSNVISEWEEGGRLREAYMDVQHTSWESEEELISQYVKEQKQIAAEIISKELRKEIRKQVSSLIVNTDRNCNNLSDISSTHIANMEQYSNVMDTKGGPDDLEMTTSLLTYANSFHSKIEQGLDYIRNVNRENLKLASKVAILREISVRITGDDVDILSPALLDMV